MSLEEILEIAAGVIVQDGRYLITRRYDESHQGGAWEFPGGKREEEETLADCLRREIKEELDLEVEVGRPLRTIRYAYALCTVELHFFLCTIASGTPKTAGCQDFEWVRPDQLAHYSFPAANQAILEDLVGGVDQ
jgi:mutator protein MutT